MRILILIAVISLLALVIISCDSEDPIGPEDVLFDLAAFPQNDGDYWVYARTDNNSGAVDTITISILETLHFDCDEPDCIFVEQLWEIRSASVIDSQTTTINNNSIRLCNFMSGTTLHFPLQVGDTWSDMIPVDDTTDVTEMVTMTVPDGSIPFCFHLDRRVTYLDTWEEVELWVAPAIGIVKMTWAADGMGPNLDQTWELIECGNTPTDNFTLDRFPVTTGCWWEYRIQDQLLGTTETMTVACIDTDFVADFQIWMHSDGINSELHYSMADADRIVFYREGNIEDTYRSLQFPLRLGQAWVTEPGFDTNYVGEIVSFRLPTNELADAYRVWTYYWCGDLCNHTVNSYYVPEVGLVRKLESHTEYDPVRGETVAIVKRVWTLLNYHIEP